MTTPTPPSAPKVEPGAVEPARVDPSRADQSRADQSRVDQSRVRDTNLRLVARTVFAADPPVTRAEVAATTAMTRATVSRLVDDLVGGRIVAELEPVTRVGRGRPGTPLVPDSGRFVGLGLQVNVGYLAAVVVDLCGIVRARRLVVADQRGPAPREVLSRLADLAAEALAELGPGRVVAGAGLALPGIVSRGTGLLLRAPNLGWSDVVVPELIDADSWGGAALAVGNEADLAARTVSSLRPGRPSPLRDFIYLSGETGIGGAVVVDGTALGGRHGWAGEIGHVTVDPAGPPCACGSTGCLEQYAGKRALLEAAGLEPESPASLLTEQVRRGDPHAIRAVDSAAWALGCAVAGVVNVVDVPVVVLGGHLREVAELLRPRLEEVLQARVLSARWLAPTIETARDDPALGALGAAYRELERVIADPALWLGHGP